nr:mediator of RNA polymerase II transcription subunit 14 [Ipomoea batatas]
MAAALTFLQAAEESYGSLKELVEKSRSSDLPDFDKKRGILQYLVKTQQRMLRLNVIAKWFQLLDRRMRKEYGLVGSEKKGSGIRAKKVRGADISPSGGVSSYARSEPVDPKSRSSTSDFRTRNVGFSSTRQRLSSAGRLNSIAKWFQLVSVTSSYRLKAREKGERSEEYKMELIGILVWRSRILIERWSSRNRFGKFSQAHRFALHRNDWTTRKDKMINKHCHLGEINEACHLESHVSF